MKIKRTFHTDPGHGWLEVHYSELAGFETEITRWSYQKGDKVFLEEDCDATKFVEEMKNRGIEIEFVEKYQHRSPIRNYAPYQARASFLCI
jgi:hypothetical protein